MEKEKTNSINVLLINKELTMRLKLVSLQLFTEHFTHEFMEELVVSPESRSW